MDKGTKNLLLFGGLGVVAVGAWYFLAGPGAAPTSTSALPSSSGGGSSSASSAPPTPWTNPANASMVNSINQWLVAVNAGTSGWGPLFQTALPQITQANLQNLYNIIQVWGGNQPASTSLTNWWYAWSKSIGIND